MWSEVIYYDSKSVDESGSTTRRKVSCENRTACLASADKGAHRPVQIVETPSVRVVFDRIVVVAKILGSCSRGVPRPLWDLKDTVGQGGVCLLLTRKGRAQ